MIVYGMNPVLEALKAGRVSVSARRSRGASVQQVLSAGRSPRRPVCAWRPETSIVASRDGVHQGVVAEVAAAAGV